MQSGEQKEKSFRVVDMPLSSSEIHKLKFI